MGFRRLNGEGRKIVECDWRRGVGYLMLLEKGEGS